MFIDATPSVFVELCWFAGCFLTGHRRIPLFFTTNSNATNTNSNATTTMSINNTTNNSDKMNIKKMKCSKDYDIIGTLQGYYAVVPPEHQVGVHKRRWGLDGG